MLRISKHGKRSTRTITLSGLMTHNRNFSFQTGFSVLSLTEVVLMYTAGIKSNGFFFLPRGGDFLEGVAGSPYSPDVAFASPGTIPSMQYGSLKPVGRKGGFWKRAALRSEWRTVYRCLVQPCMNIGRRFPADYLLLPICCCLFAAGYLLMLFAAGYLLLSNCWCCLLPAIWFAKTTDKLPNDRSCCS